MEINNEDFSKLGNALEDLKNSIMNKKDIEKVLNTFKLLKENKYSVFIEKDKVINKENYNEVELENKAVN